MNFSGHGSNTAFLAGGSDYFDNASPRVPVNISETGNSSGVAYYASPQFMAGSSAQMSQNTCTLRRASGISILNPTSQGHQGSNFNAQRSGATNQPGGRLFRAWRRWSGMGFGNLCFHWWNCPGLCGCQGGRA
ncbi:hypothetical protein L873DRAFT_79535 [Choiromyces venosus 120613-1]|uniref:Uncharacterized protein n=1 Tax=Choiromyces venosus 120613-1 TaxID=1336337 RepID=A0A3N4J4I8_9PEZI|nr:hypothetical protein L873DRAFT_79535 [Choiromyces venosus 120613-1]